MFILLGWLHLWEGVCSICCCCCEGREERGSACCLYCVNHTLHWTSQVGWLSERTDEHKHVIHTWKERKRKIKMEGPNYTFIYNAHRLMFYYSHQCLWWRKLPLHWECRDISLQTPHDTRRVPRDSSDQYWPSQRTSETLQRNEMETVWSIMSNQEITVLSVLEKLFWEYILASYKLLSSITVKVIFS